MPHSVEPSILAHGPCHSSGSSFSLWELPCACEKITKLKLYAFLLLLRLCQSQPEIFRGLRRNFTSPVLCSVVSVVSLCDPWAVAHQALSMEFSRQEYWGELPCPPPGDLPDPGIKLGSPALQMDSLPATLKGYP